MQVHATSEFPTAVVVTPDSLMRLWSHVEDYAGQAEATVQCADDIVRKFGSIESLLAFENAPRAAMISLEIDGRSQEQQRTIGITIGRRYSVPSSLSVRGEELDVSTMKTKVSDTVYGMKAWYSPVAKVDLAMVWGAVFFILFLMLQLMSSSEPSSRPGRSFAEALKLLPWVFSVLGAVAATIFAVAKLRTRFFPLVSFAIGQGLGRHQFDEQVRWSVLVSFLVGLAGSVVYGAMSGA